MAISKSTPYVRYKKDFTSSLHLGTIHIESEYLDRTQKTTIESIHGMTWHNKVVNENKELNLLSDTQLELTDLEKQYWNTGEKCVSVDEIHTLEEVEPNEDGTYTYTVNSMEGEYIEIYDGINNITSTSDGLDGQFEIVYDTTEEDINGNIALDAVAPQYEITDSGVGAITGAKSTGLTLVNNITESSKEEVVAIEQQEGKHFTIENTVQGNIKSATLKGQTLVNYFNPNTISELTDEGYLLNEPDFSKQRVFNYIPLQPYEDNTEYTVIVWLKDVVNPNNASLCCSFGNKDLFIDKFKNGINIAKGTTKTISGYSNIRIGDLDVKNGAGATLIGAVILKGDYTNVDIPYFEGMKSVQMPILTTTGKNLFDINSMSNINNWDTVVSNEIPYCSYKIKLKPNTTYTFSQKQFVNIENVYASFGLEKGGYEYLLAITHPTAQYPTTLKLTTDDRGLIYVKLYNANTTLETFISKLSNNQLQLEESSTATLYESFKSNILTCNEEVELRGVGDVKDELDVLNNKLTQRIEKLTLNGTEQWWEIATGRFAISEGFLENVKKPDDMWTIQMICEGATVVTYHDEIVNGGVNVIAQPHENYDFIMRSEIDNKNEFKEYLKNNPITVYYQLETPVIKTVDLTVQNQDGNTIPHIQTQQGITHVSTSSDVLTPVVEMSCSYDVIIKPNTTYTIKLDRPNVSDTMYLQVDLGGTMMMLDADVNAFTIKTPSTLSYSQLRLSGTGNTVKEIIVLEGNRVNDKIEYFEGMKNVENPILVVSNCPYVFGKGEGVTFKEYQSTTLSLNEPIQLRSIGDVHDEINYETGEYIQRIGECIYEDNLTPTYNKQIGGYLSSMEVKGKIGLVVADGMGAISDKLINQRFTQYDFGIYGNLNGNLNIFDKTVKSEEEFINKYRGTKFQFVLLEPIITKIDTTILDQNNSYKSSQQTYDEQTYISVQSDTVVTPTSSVDYEIYSSTGTVTGTSATIDNAEAGTPVSGVVYGETLLNVIQEPSETEYVCTDNFEGQSGTLENTVEGNIKSAILKGQTLVNILQNMDYVWNNLTKKDSFSYNNGGLVLMFNYLNMLKILIVMKN